MGRYVKRVPLNFGWPLKKTWPGYLTPEWLREPPCRDCDETGYSPYARRLRDRWYGKAPFHPAETGSEPYTPDHPAVRAFAERNVASAPYYYGTGEDATQREAGRLACLFNSAWNYHLSDDDVEALRAEDHRGTFQGMTAREINERSLTDPLFHLSSSSYVCIKARCERAGEPINCARCNGAGVVEAWTGQRAFADTCPTIEPPKGDGWQLWEDTSEGSPVSPVFATSDELIDWLVDTDASIFAHIPGTRDQWTDIVKHNGLVLIDIAPGVKAL